MPVLRLAGSLLEAAMLTISSCGMERSDLLVQPVQQQVFYDIHVVTGLQTKPVFRGLVEKQAQAQGHFRRHRVPSMDNMADLHSGDTNRFSQSFLADAQFIHDFFQKISRVNGGDTFPRSDVSYVEMGETLHGNGHVSTSVMVHNFNIEGILVDEPETDPPLIIDANAPLPLTITGELLQPIGWGETQVLYTQSIMKLEQSFMGARNHLCRDTLDEIPHKNSRTLFVGKCLDHNVHDKQFVYRCQWGEKGNFSMLTVNQDPSHLECRFCDWQERCWRLG